MPKQVQCGGDLIYVSEFYEKQIADKHFASLFETLAWEVETYKIYGREVKAPRLMAWYGDPEAVYTYSGVRHVPNAWLPPLAVLRADVENAAQYRFNSVLANLYRSGQDSMGWHADKEPELGSRPVIASLSFGGTRIFRLRHNRTGETLEYLLGNGDLLIMQGNLQREWKHCVPKTRRHVEPRINLTFRRVMPADLEPIVLG